MRNTAYLFLCFLFLLSCKGPASFNEVKADGFSIKIADFLTALKKPEVRSSLYYEDTLNNCLFMVVEESKDTMRAYGLKYDLNSYFDKTSKSLFDKLQDGGLANSHSENIDSNKAVVGRIAGRLNDEHLVYYLTVIETRNHFYQLICGMPVDQEARYEKDMNTMIRSFREL